MGDNEPEVFELESLNSAPKEKVEIIHMKHMYYFSFHNCGELMELLERIVRLRSSYVLIYLLL